jgi:hypothetical protein
VKLPVLGTILMILGVAVRVIAARHAPLANTNPTTFGLSRGGWSPTAYDAAQVFGWGLIIVGIVVVAFALARVVRSGA